MPASKTLLNEPLADAAPAATPARLPKSSSGPQADKLIKLGLRRALDLGLAFAVAL